MNDFTKEELIALSDGLRIMYKNGWDIGYPFHIGDFYDKVCAMIDNYSATPCVHQWKASDPKIKLEVFNGDIFDYRPLKINCKLCGVSYFK